VFQLDFSEVLNLGDKRWYNCNDSSVSRISSPSVSFLLGLYSRLYRILSLSRQPLLWVFAL